MRNAKPEWTPSFLLPSEKPYSPSPGTPGKGRTSVVALILPTLLLIIGCAASSDKAILNEGYTALQQQQYDQALAKADAYLAKRPSGSGSAEALYLRGRAYEQRSSATVQQAQANLKLARQAYVQALQSRPSRQLEAYIRTSVANVAYFQDDYGTALAQWSAAYAKIDDADTAAWTLYRIGLCQQRLGRFGEADQTFAQVQQKHAGTVPAQRASQHHGARSFFVQLATFKLSSSADNATSALRKQGLTPVRLVDTQKRHLVRLGPVQSYAQAQSLKNRFEAQYPDAIIIP